MNVFGFEPYIDWDDISDEMASDVLECVVGFRRAQESMLAYTGPSEGEEIRAMAVDLLRAQQELSTTVTAIQSTLYVIPMVVHIAGDKSSACNEDGFDQVVQRCKRCGSVLQVWIEGFRRATPEGLQEVSADDMVWWQENEVIAKAASEGGHRMYLIENRELEEFERPCPDLTMLGT